MADRTLERMALQLPELAVHREQDPESQLVLWSVQDGNENEVAYGEWCGSDHDADLQAMNVASTLVRKYASHPLMIHLIQKAME